MNRMRAQHTVRPLFAAMAILSIFLVGCLSTGAPLANAQAEEALTTDDRLENIEDLLVILIEIQDNIQTDLDNMHATYVTREILEYEISSLNTEMAAMESSMSSELRALGTEISALHVIIGTYVEALNARVGYNTQITYLIIAAVLGGIVTTVLPRMSARKDVAPAETPKKTS